jgi:DNA-binding transcriptional MerR regulator
MSTVNKSAEAFRTISEVAVELDVPKHVLRFWEMRFPQIKPMKRGGGRRYYRPTDVELLKGIRHLLHAEGYTIKGVQKILRDQGLDEVQKCWQPGAVIQVPDGPRTGPKATEPLAGQRIRSLRLEGRASASERLKAMRGIIAELERCRDLLVTLRPVVSAGAAAGHDVQPSEPKKRKARGG